MMRLMSSTGQFEEECTRTFMQAVGPFSSAPQTDTALACYAFGQPLRLTNIPAAEVLRWAHASPSAVWRAHGCASASVVLSVSAPLPRAAAGCAWPARALAVVRMTIADRRVDEVLNPS